MRYALCDPAGLVVNVIEYDGKAKFDAPRGWTLRPATPTDQPLAPEPAVTNASIVRQRLAAYLALPAPTAAQSAAAVRALIRVTLGALDDVTDT
jgi:hypothetical protein